MAEPQTGGAHQPAKIGQRRNLGEVLQIALEIGADVAVEPNRAFGACPQRESGGRESAAQREGPPVLRLIGTRRQDIKPVAVFGTKKFVPSAGPSIAALFSAGHGPEREVARPAGERFGHLFHPEQVRRSGEQEAAGGAVAIDGPLHRPQQIGRTLHLVERHRRAAADEDLGITAGRVKGVQIVE